MHSNESKQVFCIILLTRGVSHHTVSLRFHLSVGRLLAFLLLLRVAQAYVCYGGLNM